MVACDEQSLSRISAQRGRPTADASTWHMRYESRFQNDPGKIPLGAIEWAPLSGERKGGRGEEGRREEREDG